VSVRPLDCAVRVLAALAAGTLLAASLPPHALGWVAWCGLVPLLLAWRGTTVVQGALLGWLAGIAYEGLVTIWVQSVLVQHTGLRSPAVLAAHGVMAALLGLEWAAIGAVARVRPRAWWVTPAAWVACEWLRSWTPLGFPWTSLGYSQYRYPALVQMAAVSGVFGVTGVVVAVNAAAAEMLSEVGRRRLLPALLTTALVIVAWGGGYLRLVAGGDEPSRALAVGIVQGQVDERDKWVPEFADQTLQRYERLTRATVGDRPALVIWPETALPFFLEDGGARRDRVFALARDIGAYLLVGAPAFEVGGGPGLAQYNRVHLIGPDGQEHGSYDKTVLVPFGEYVPSSWLRRLIRPVAPMSAPIAAGGDAHVLTTADVRLGVLVCYEAVFPWLGRHLVQGGAEMLVEVANDSWFRRTGAPAQEAAHAVLRAVELGVPFIRVSNAGVSLVVDGNGRTVWRDDHAVPSWHVVSIAMRPRTLTPYARWGNWLPVVCALLTVASMIRARSEPTRDRLQATAAAVRERSRSTAA
jgi:apolipoprotein N-acyltransferase